LSRSFFGIAGTTLILLGLLIGGYVLSRDIRSISNQQSISSVASVVTPDNLEEKLKEGEILLLQNNKISTEKALNLFNELAAKNTSSDLNNRIRFGLGVALYKNKDRLVALEIFKELNQIKDLKKDEREKVSYHLGNILLQINQEEEGKAHLEDVLRSSDNHKLRSGVFNSLGDFYLKRRDSDKARKNYILAVYEDPNNVHARIGWRRAIRSLGRNMDSLDLFDDYIEEQPVAQYKIQENQENSANGISQLEKGRHFFDRKDYNKAISHLNKALSYPLSSISKERAFHYLTESYFGLGKNSQALRYAQETLYNPVSNLDPAAHYRKGTIFYKQGKYTEAAAEFDSVIDKFPNSPYIEKAKAYKKESLTMISENQKYNPESNLDKSEENVIDENEEE
jgi:tetratricopeptide (TPR) repeat protein